MIDLIISSESAACRPHRIRPYPPTFRYRPSENVGGAETVRAFEGLIERTIPRAPMEEYVPPPPLNLSFLIVNTVIFLLCFCLTEGASSTALLIIRIDDLSQPFLVLPAPPRGRFSIWPLGISVFGTCFTHR